MTLFVLIMFWFGLAVIVYTYIGYGLVITILAKFTGPFQGPVVREHELPDVTILIAAYNEEQCIELKIRNTLELDYPADKLSILIVTDGSTDQTPGIVKKFHAVKLFHEPQRKGKIHAVNRVMKEVKTPIVVFSDANTILNRPAVRNIVRHYADQTVGGVAGEKRIFKNEADAATASGEGLYWKYESYLKKKDAQVYSVIGAAGELFSIRTDLYESPPENAIIEDFILSVSMAAKGFRFAYEPDAYATETASTSISEEWKRKVRICAGGFQAMVRLRYLLNPFKYGLLSFQYVSHRVLRWTLAPFFLPLVLLANMWLAVVASPLYSFLLFGQVLFYLLGIAGYAFRDRNVAIKGFFAPYYFLVMNLAVYAGLKRYLSGQQSVIWEKAERASMTPQSVKT